jgi:hypothetical protein
VSLDWWISRVMRWQCGEQEHTINSILIIGRDEDEKIASIKLQFNLYFDMKG